MYEKHFGLRERPFRALSDCSRYYPSTTHEQALALLEDSFAGQDGLALVTGEPGMGKTLVCHCLMHRAGDNVRGAYLGHGPLGDRNALLQALAFELGLPHTGSTEQLKLALVDRLLEDCADENSTLLVVDEAHHLQAGALEELRLLANLENGKTRAVHAVLVGLPAVLETLEDAALASLRQRLAVRVRLEPLPEAEAADYLLHHLRLVVDRPEKVISAEALALLARGSRGVPRLLSQSCHRALTLACLGGADIVDTEAAMEALLALGLEVDESGETGPVGDSVEMSSGEWSEAA